MDLIRHIFEPKISGRREYRKGAMEYFKVDPIYYRAKEIEK